MTSNVIVECTDEPAEDNGSYDEGYADGKADGYLEGEAAGYDNGIGVGYENGRAEGLVVGENNGRMELINLITQNGTRTTYTRAFNAQDWSGFTFPEGMLNPEITKEMFYDYRGKQLPKGIWCDRGQTSQTANNGGSMFRYAYVLEEIYDMNVPPISNSMDHYFGDCNKLQKIEKLRVLESTTYNNPFNKCYALKYIRFEGTIGNDITFTGCPLDKDSIKNIIGVLSTDTTGKTVTFSTSAVNTAFETSAGASDGSTSAEWTALIATKSNWTISLV
jgi:hypothetical protein